MKFWRYWIISGLILLLWSGLASSQLPQSHFAPNKIGFVSGSHGVLGSQLISDLSGVCLDEVKIQENLVDELSVNELAKLLSMFFDAKHFSNDTLPLVPTGASAMLFRDSLQTKPVYCLKTEFFSTDIPSHLKPELRFEQNDSPWFMRSNLKSNCRVSGWKDGNFLYTASITYY